MNVPEHWLRSFCNPPLKTEKLAHLLTMSGLEVEACSPVAPPFSGVVVGEILSVERHPNADKLTVCVVNAGSEKSQVVCGAPNVRAGHEGAARPRGDGAGGHSRSRRPCCAASRAAACSAPRASSGCRRTIPACSSCRDGKPGATCAVLDLDEQVLTFKLTPNRADCLSVLGVAREVSALTGAKLAVPGIKPVAAKAKQSTPSGSRTRKAAAASPAA